MCYCPRVGRRAYLDLSRTVGRMKGAMDLAQLHHSVHMHAWQLA